MQHPAEQLAIDIYFYYIISFCQLHHRDHNYLPAVGCHRILYIQFFPGHIKQLNECRGSSRAVNMYVRKIIDRVRINAHIGLRKRRAVDNPLRAQLHMAIGIFEANAVISQPAERGGINKAVLICCRSCAFARQAAGRCKMTAAVKALG